MGQARNRGNFEVRKAEGMIQNAIKAEETRKLILQKQQETRDYFDSLTPQEQERIDIISIILQACQTNYERCGVKGKRLQRVVNSVFNELKDETDESLKDIIKQITPTTIEAPVEDSTVIGE